MRGLFVSHCIAGSVALLSVPALGVSSPHHAGDRLGARTSLVVLDAWDERLLILIETLIDWMREDPPPQMENLSRAAWLDELNKAYLVAGVPILAEPQAMAADVEAAYHHLQERPERVDPALLSESLAILRAMYSDLGFDPGGL